MKHPKPTELAKAYEVPKLRQPLESKIGGFESEKLQLVAAFRDPYQIPRSPPCQKRT